VVADVFDRVWQLDHCNINCFLPSVLWHCSLGGRKGIQPVKKLNG